MSIFNKLKKGVSEAGSKAKNTVEETRMKSQIKKGLDEIEVIYKEIGKVVYTSYESDNMILNDTIKKHIAGINEIHKKNKEIEEKIQEVWNQKMCKCGNTVVRDAKFCSACGEKFEEEQPAVTNQAVVSQEATVIPTDEKVSVQKEETDNEAANVSKEVEQDDETSQYICKNCDAELEEDSRFCGSCGSEV